jgi:hypothetical protein
MTETPETPMGEPEPGEGVPGDPTAPAEGDEESSEEEEEDE